jgi:hypothetical protein
MTEAQRRGIWRLVVGDEIFPPGRQFRMNVVTGQREVFEPADETQHTGLDAGEGGSPPDLARIAALRAGPEDAFLATGAGIVADTATGHRQCQPRWWPL